LSELSTSAICQELEETHRTNNLGGHNNVSMLGNLAICLYSICFFGTNLAIIIQHLNYDSDHKGLVK